MSIRGPRCGLRAGHLRFRKVTVGMTTLWPGVVPRSGGSGPAALAVRLGAAEGERDVWL